MSVCLYAINHTITTHYLLGNLKKKVRGETPTNIQSSGRLK